MDRQSEGFKRAAVQKYHNRGSRTVVAVAREIGVSDALLYAWSKRYAISPGMKKEDRRPQDWSAAEKFKAVMAFDQLPEHALTRQRTVEFRAPSRGVGARLWAGEVALP